MPNRNDITRAQAAVRPGANPRRGPGATHATQHRRRWRPIERVSAQQDISVAADSFGRSLGSALLTGALSRLPMGRFIGKALFGRKAYR